MRRKAIISILSFTLLISAILTSCNETDAENIEKELTKYLDEIHSEEQAEEPSDSEEGKIAPAEKQKEKKSKKKQKKSSNKKLEDLSYNGQMSVVINDNKPTFTKKEKRKIKEYFHMSELDSLGRCGKAEALVSSDTLAKEDRGSIGMIRPSGWPKRISEAKYDIVEGKYLYNRCHLIMYALYGNITNDERNLITGTRMLNVGSSTQEGMLTYENKILEYVRTHRGNKVLYRVTPIFKGDELVARGVNMEAYSVDDNGKGICFNVYIYNHQDGITIDYRTGDSSLS